MTRRPLAAAFLSFALLLGACTGSGADVASRSPRPSPATPSVTTSSGPSAVPTGEGSAAAALEALCKRPPPRSTGSEAPAEGPTPPLIRQVEHQVEQLRGLTYTRDVPVDAVTHDELVAGLRKSYASSFPKQLMARKSAAWTTIGAIPEGTSLRQQLEAFGGSQVIGYYDTVGKALVFQGSDEPSPLERATLAHELTHALDDQHFDLSRIDQLASGCQDERFEAALGLVEGSAQRITVAYLQQVLTPQEQVQALQEASTQDTGTSGIVPFVMREQTWPYTVGLAFALALAGRGGNAALDRALRNLPVSTEQVIHPEKYPGDVPTPVDVPDLGPALGPGWHDLDVQDVGEEWLSILLGLRLAQSEAAQDAAGWDGGLYRAWVDGDRIAIVMRTVWDTTTDATEFADGMRSWIADGDGQAAVQPVEATNVTVLFASDAVTLAALRSAA